MNCTSEMTLKYFTMIARIRVYLLSLLNGSHGVWLEFQLVCPAQFPVEDGNDDNDH